MIKRALMRWHRRAIGSPTLTFSGTATGPFVYHNNQDIKLIHPESGLTCTVSGRGFGFVFDSCQFLFKKAE